MSKNAAPGRCFVFLANITGDWYWVLIAVVVLFGGTQLPKLARNAGEAMREFRKAHNDAMAEPNAGVAPPPAALGTQPAPAPAPSAMPATPLPAGVPATGSAQGDERVTLTRDELDALLAHREAQARAGNTPPAGS